MKRVMVCDKTKFFVTFRALQNMLLLERIKYLLKSLGQTHNFCTRARKGLV